MRITFLCIVSVCAFAATTFSVHAEERSDAGDVALPAGVFRMSDGKYYEPSRGILSADLQEIVSRVSSVSTTQPIVASSTEDVRVQLIPLKRAIQRGREMIERLIEQNRSPTPRIEASDAGWRPVTLAIWNPRTDGIRLVQVLKRGTHLRSDANGRDGISVSRSNGVNSEFVITGNDGEIVVAIQYPIYREKILTKKKKHYEVHEVVYTPYSKGLHTPEMIRQGKRWFDDVVTSVFGQLRADGVVSRAFPDKLLADVLEPSIIERITIIEHLDDAALRKDPGRHIEAFYVTLAANEEQAYTHAKSKAGALGLVQFIPKTYAAIAKWPQLRIHPNFEFGMRDPKNAIRAQAAYLDYLLSRLPEEARASGIASAYVEEVVAASYNGGATRAVRAMSVWEDNFDPQKRLQIKTRARLKLETMKYVLKLRTLREQRSFGSEARSL